MYFVSIFFVAHIALFMFYEKKLTINIKNKLTNIKTAVTITLSAEMYFANNMYRYIGKVN